jgi:hypothetical protein
LGAEIPIGNVGTDDDDISLKNDKDTYVITNAIQTPVIEGK